MKIEVLFPEICNLYGDLQNTEYLKRCNNEIELVETHLSSTPKFLQEDVGLVYMGSTTEIGQKLALETLLPYKEEIRARAERGQHMLFTGNATDLLGREISSDFEEAGVLEGLGIFDATVHHTMLKRHNSFFLGTYDFMNVVGFKSQFGHMECSDDSYPLFTVQRGVGRNPNCSVEGFHYHNLYATYLLGPLFLLNPPFTKAFLKDLGLNDSIAYEDASMASYEKRCKEFADPSRNVNY